MSERDKETPPPVALAYTNEAGNRRRVSFYRREPGGWDRVVEERDGDEWRAVGGEIVADPSITVTIDGLEALDIARHRDGSGTVCTGP